jgi:cell division protein FtsQ
MSRNRASGAAVIAPEERFTPGESPSPGPVAGTGRGRRAARGIPDEESEVRDRRPAHSRALLVLRFMIGLTIVAVVATAVAMSAHRYAVTSSRFALRRVEVKGGKRIGPDQAERVAGLTLGTNLFALDTQAAEQKLLKNPWVQSARVFRELPGTLKVELSEREAVAIASITDGLYVVSAEGEPFKRLEPADPVDLPVVTGISPSGLARDRARELDRLERGLEVLRQYRRLKLERVYPAQEVHLEPGGSVRLIIGSEGITLSLGRDSLRQRLLMAERVVTETRAAGRLPGIVFADNVAHPERVVVRLR